MVEAHDSTLAPLGWKGVFPAGGGNRAPSPSRPRRPGPPLSWPSDSSGSSDVFDFSAGPDHRGTVGPSPYSDPFYQQFHAALPLESSPLHFPSPVLELRCLRLGPDANLPVRFTASPVFQLRPPLSYSAILWPGRLLRIPTGLVIDVPAGYRAQVEASSVAFRLGLWVCDVIPAGMTTELQVWVKNVGYNAVWVKSPLFFCQFTVQKCEPISLVDITP